MVSKKSAKIIGSLAKKVIRQAELARQRIANSIPAAIQAADDVNMQGMIEEEKKEEEVK